MSNKTDPYENQKREADPDQSKIPLLDQDVNTWDSNTDATPAKRAARRDKKKPWWKKFFGVFTSCFKRKLDEEKEGFISPEENSAKRKKKDSPKDYLISKQNTSAEGREESSMVNEIVALVPRVPSTSSSPGDEVVADEQAGNETIADEEADDEAVVDSAVVDVVHDGAIVGEVVVSEAHDGSAVVNVLGENSEREDIPNQDDIAEHDNIVDHNNNSDQDASPIDEQAAASDSIIVEDAPEEAAAEEPVSEEPIAIIVENDASSVPAEIFAPSPMVEQKPLLMICEKSQVSSEDLQRDLLHEPKQDPSPFTSNVPEQIDASSLPCTDPSVQSAASSEETAAFEEELTAAPKQIRTLTDAERATNYRLMGCVIPVSFSMRNYAGIYSSFVAEVTELYSSKVEACMTKEDLESVPLSYIFAMEAIKEVIEISKVDGNPIRKALCETFLPYASVLLIDEVARLRGCDPSDLGLSSPASIATITSFSSGAIPAEFFGVASQDSSEVAVAEGETAEVVAEEVAEVVTEIPSNIPTDIPTDIPAEVPPCQEESDPVSDCSPDPSSEEVQKEKDSLLHELISSPLFVRCKRKNNSDEEEEAGDRASREEERERRKRIRSRIAKIGTSTPGIASPVDIEIEDKRRR